MLENPILAYDPMQSTGSYDQGQRLDLYVGSSGWFQDPSRPPVPQAAILQIYEGDFFLK